MKIGIILADTPAYSETFFISKIKGLQKNGFKVVLIVGKHKPNFNLCPVFVQPKVKSYYFIKALINTLLLCITNYSIIKRFYLLEKKRKNNFKIIFKKIVINQHLFKIKELDWLHFGFATQAIEREHIAEAMGAKMAVSLRGFDIGIYPLKYPNCYDLLWQKVDKLHVISNDLLEKAYQNGFLKEKAYQKITPAIDVDYFNDDTKKTNTKNQFLTVGRIHWKKGYEDTLLALSLLKKQGIEFTYTIVGSGNDEERIKYAAFDLDLVDDVVFKGKLTRDETKVMYTKSNLYIQYSIQEGFCNAVLEAQAMGVLPIVSDAEGLSENVLNNQTGWVVPKNNPTLLAQKIEEVLLLSENEKEQMRSVAIKRIKQEFNIKKQAQEFVAFYKN